MLIERPPLLFRKLVPRGEFRLTPPESDKRPIYLTFDDGPIPQATPQVLDILDHYGIKATFFMVGDNVRKYPDLAHEVLARGHRLGNHTMHHLQGVKVSAADYLADIAEAERYLPRDTRFAGKKPLFRPPHGWLKPSQANILARDYRIIMYDLVTRDYSKRVDADRVLRNVKRYTEPGSIIVFHDSLRSIDKLRHALPEAIKWLISQGYEPQLL